MPRDLRKYAQQTNTQLIFGGILVLFLVGDGLIWLIYGREAAILGLTCMGLGLLPVILIFLVFLGMDWVIKRSKKD